MLVFLNNCGKIIMLEICLCVEMVDKLDSKSSGETRAGSSPATGTISFKVRTDNYYWFFFCCIILIIKGDIL